MLPSIPNLRDYSISSRTGFLPEEPPLRRLPDHYYDVWEQVISGLQPLLLANRLRELIDEIPVLSTARLRSDAELQRAYVILSFLAHSYIWGGETPAEELPRSISIPYLDIAKRLEVPPVATYASLCLWNYRPLFPNESTDSLENLATNHTFTGSLDESWFYLVSVAIEARGAPVLQIMLNAIAAARENDARLVTKCLHSFAERLDDLASLLMRLNEMCDPHTFYFRIRPFLAGSKNMEDAGLPNGVKYIDGSGSEAYRQYSGGSNAQSSLIQAFDILLGIEHRPTGEVRPAADQISAGTSPPKKHNFIQEMRNYMPGPHRRFLEHLSMVANIRDFVEANSSDQALTVAYDSCLHMLRAFRDKHIQIVSRYIVLPAKEARRVTGQGKAIARGLAAAKNTTTNGSDKFSSSKSTPGMGLTGTGGTALIPFLKQARDETGEPSIGAWAKRLLSKSTVATSFRDRQLEEEAADIKLQGLAGQWLDSEDVGGICQY